MTHHYFSEEHEVESHLSSGRWPRNRDGVGHMRGKRPPTRSIRLILLLFLKALVVVFIKDRTPGVQVDGSHGACDEQHERQLHHVADLHQHDGSDEGQHSYVVVVLGVLHAAAIQLHLGCHVVRSHVVLETAKLEARTREGRRVKGAISSRSEGSLSDGSLRSALRDM